MSSASQSIDDLIPQKIAASIIGWQLRWMQRARKRTKEGQKYGPPWTKVGNRIMYSRKEIQRWKRQGNNT
jgi:hypothetical protein